MDNIYIFTEKNGTLEPVRIKGDLYRKHLDLKTGSGTGRIDLQFDAEKLLFGDILMAEFVPGTMAIEPIRRVQHFAKKGFDPVIASAKGALIETMDNSIGQIREGLKMLQDAKSNRISVKDVIGRLNEIKQQHIDREIQAGISAKSAKVVNIAKRYEKPVTVGIGLKPGKSGDGFRDFKAYLDLGSQAVLVDKKAGKDILTEKVGFINISGIAGGVVSAPAYNCRISIDGVETDLKCAEYDGLRGRIGYDVLLDQSVFHFFKEKGVSLI